MDPPGFDGDNQFHEVFWPQKRYTIPAHMISACSRAAGATDRLIGEFDPDQQVDLGRDGYSFGDGDYSHSAEFLSNFAARGKFYETLLQRFGLSIYLP